MAARNQLFQCPAADHPGRAVENNFHHKPPDFIGLDEEGCKVIPREHK
jgi:hypothetical protein